MKKLAEISALSFSSVLILGSAADAADGVVGGIKRCHARRKQASESHYKTTLAIIDEAGARGKANRPALAFGYQVVPIR